MSRIGKMPVVVPEKVNVSIDGTKVTVKGPKGELFREFSPTVTIKQEGNEIIVTRTSEEKRSAGLTRNNPRTVE